MTYLIRKGGLLVYLFSLLILSTPFRAEAQFTVVPPEAVPDSTNIWLVSTIDENEFFGMIVQRTTEHIRLATTSLGEIDIPIFQIRQMKLITEDRIVEGELWPENIQASRYFIGTNGHGLRKGHGYYQNAWVFFNQFAIGFSDYAALGVGMIPTFLFGADALPVWINPSFSLPLAGKDGKVHLGVGGFAAAVIGDGDEAIGGLNGTLTYGTRDRNISVGVGQGILDGGFGDQVALTFGAMLRGGKKGYAILEGTLWDLDSGAEGFLLIGGRTVGKNLTFDFGLIVPVEEEINFALPWISISAPFGN